MVMWSEFQLRRSKGCKVTVKGHGRIFRVCHTLLKAKTHNEIFHAPNFSSEDQLKPKLCKYSLEIGIKPVSALWTSTLCTLVWWQLWNFILTQVIINSFLHPNEPPSKDFFVFCKATWGGLVKNLPFSVSKVKFFLKINFIFLRIIFVLEY